MIVVGGTALLWSPTVPGHRVFDDPAYIPAAWRTITQASLDQFAACQKYPYDLWTYVSPPAIFEQGPRTGQYKRGAQTLLVDEHGTSRISAADFAIAVIDELETPGEDNHFTMATFCSDNTTMAARG